MGLADKLKKEAKSIKEDIVKEAKSLRREIRDDIKPPSTFEEVKRVGADMLNDLEREGKNLKGDIKDIFAPVIKAVKEGLKEAKDAARAGEILEKLHDKVPFNKNVSFTKDLKHFLKSMGTVFTSILKDDKTQEKAWGNLKKATSKLKGTIKKTLLVKTGIVR
ncbi:MAG: hypothetical protein LN561_01210 [Rickettsia endosymbiont of Labidopullus appendiculatus]|nr:hypothetical protein [Rickettsia endosymbiont of Labidopullus appendiculatus]